MMSFSSMSSAILNNLLVQKASFVLILVFAIMIVQDEGASVFGALQHHEPSLRIFQSLLQINLILFEAALSLYLWIYVMGASTVASLLFQPIYEHHPETTGATMIQTMAASFSAIRGGGGGDGDDGDDNDALANDHDENNTPSQQQLHRRQQQQYEHYSPGHDLVLTEEDDAGGSSGGNGVAQGTSSDDDLDQSHHRNTLLAVSNYPFVLCGWALDMMLVIFVTLFLFTLTSSFNTSSNDDGTQQQQGIGRVFSRIAAPTFPLVLFFYLLVRAFFPWNRGGGGGGGGGPSRRSFWMVVYYTLSAPWFPVTFRDGFIGDIITSSVRPLQDICFTIFYFLFGLQGWYTSQDSYRDKSFVHEADAEVPTMEKSWIVHTVVLPMCMVSPLWWRFLQTLRQCHDERRRWPYLGNALKYFIAAQVAMLGVFQPSRKQSVAWIASFVIATLYQIYWDIFMDWELLVYASSSSSSNNNKATGDRGRRRWRLRPQRLYPNRCCLYWTICMVNFILRFCWTLSFIPLRYLSAAGVLTEAFSSSSNTGENDQDGSNNDTGSTSRKISLILGPIIATAEIIRRGLWGLLRFEWEVIKTSQNNIAASKVDDDDDDEATCQEEPDGVECTPMKIQGRNDDDGNSDGRDGIMFSNLHPMTTTGGGATTSPGRHAPIMRHLLASADMSHMNSIQVLLELGLYATTFCVLGFVWAYHRGTL